MMLVSLKTKIFVGLSFSVLLVFSFFSFYTFNETSKTIIEKENEMLETLSQSINIKMEGQIEAAEIGAISLANNQAVLKLFANRDRDGLADILLPAFDKISNSISQVQFHLPDSTSFLRLHKPEKYGDSLKEFRFTVNKANEEREIVKGLEKGVAGFGFRVVVPMSYNNIHLGTVEYGSDFGTNFLEHIKQNNEGDYFIYQFDDETTTASTNNTTLIASTTETDIWNIEQENHIEQLHNNEIVYLQTTDKKADRKSVV